MSERSPLNKIRPDFRAGVDPDALGSLQRHRPRSQGEAAATDLFKEIQVDCSGRSDIEDHLREYGGGVSAPRRTYD